MFGYFNNLLARIKNIIFEPSLFDELFKELSEYEKLEDSKQKFLLLAQTHLRLSNGFAIARVYGESINYKFNDAQIKLHIKLSQEYREKAFKYEI